MNNNRASGGHGCVFRTSYHCVPCKVSCCIDYANDHFFWVRPAVLPQTLGTMAQVTARQSAAFLRLHSPLQPPPWLEHKVDRLCALLRYTLLAGLQSNASLCVLLYGGFTENNYFNYYFVAPKSSSPGDQTGNKSHDKHHMQSYSPPPAPNPSEVLP